MFASSSSESIFILGAMVSLSPSLVLAFDNSAKGLFVCLFTHMNLGWSERSAGENIDIKLFTSLRTAVFSTSLQKLPQHKYWLHLEN